MQPHFQKFLTRKHTLLTDSILVSAWNDKKRFSQLTGIKEYVQNLEILDGEFYFDMNWMEQITRAYANEPLAVFWQFTRKGYKYGEQIRNFARHISLQGTKSKLQKEFLKSINLLKNLLSR